MKRAEEHKTNGQHAQAIDLCLNVLSDEPENDQALFILGSTKLAQRLISPAYEFLRRAVELSPLPTERTMQFVTVCLTLGKLEEAQDCLREAIKLSPRSVGLRIHLSTVSLMRKQPEEALSAALTAYGLSPRNYQVHICLGSAQIASQNPIEAKYHFIQALELKSDSTIAIINLAQIALVENRFDDAIDLVARAEKHGALDEVGLITRGRALVFLGRADEAIDHHATFNRQTNAFVRISVDLVEALLSFGDAERAMAVSDNSLQSRPNSQRLLRQRAQLQIFLGDDRAAQEDLKQILSQDPQNTGALIMLASLIEHHDGAEITMRIRDLSRQSDLSAAERSAIDFSMANVQKALGDTQAEISYLHSGNKYRKQDLQYSIEQDVVIFEEIQRAFERVRHEHHRFDPPETRRQPLFIIGMPRSGTTLVEQILSAHSNVFGAGELPCLSQAMDQHVLNVHCRDQDDVPALPCLQQMAEQYCKYIQYMGGHEGYVVDKQPLNFRFLGFTRLMFPDAKIIHMNRDPRAVCWSIYRQNFVGRGNGYAYNLEDIARYYRMYLDMMEYWRSQMPDTMLEVGYERLVADPETQAKKILAYCDLPWQSQCLDVEQNRRAVKTASIRQVRKPIYTGSSDAWKKYSPHLEEMLSRLKSLDVPLPD